MNVANSKNIRAHIKPLWDKGLCFVSCFGHIILLFTCIPIGFSITVWLGYGARRKHWLPVRFKHKTNRNVTKINAHCYQLYLLTHVSSVSRSTCDLDWQLEDQGSVGA